MGRSLNKKGRILMEMKRRQPIGVELVRRGIISENDVNKAVEYQRNHPTKKLRPLASKEVSIKQASFIMVALAVIDIVLMSILYINVRYLFHILIFLQWLPFLTSQ